MRLLFLVLLVLVGLIQYPLWLGKGGWFKVWDLQGQIVAERATNEGLRARNAALAAEVRDLRTGTGALEERARGELGMMKDGEVFVQIVPHDAQAAAGAPSGDAATVSGVNPAAVAQAANKGHVSAAQPVR
jgi:cell division protein FtsB